MKIKKLEFHKVNAHITYNNGFKLVIPKKQVYLDVQIDHPDFFKLFGRKK